MHKRHVVWTATAAAALILVGSAAYAVGRSQETATASPAAMTRPGRFPTGGAGIFTDRCAYSHQAADDPIMMPGMTGGSMHHDFFGNLSTDASSTAKSLLQGRTSCGTAADASAYWLPVLYQDGHALTPQRITNYWRQPARLAHAVHTVPAGLQMIAGDETAASPQPRSVVKWTCSRPMSQRRTATTSPRTCSSGQIRAVVSFPSCWDGHTLAGANQTNVTYPSRRGCPASHPIEIPQLVVHAVYPARRAAGLRLSTGPDTTGSTNTMHADFINGWDQRLLGANVTTCIASGTRCGQVTGADATPQGPRRNRRDRRGA